MKSACMMPVLTVFRYGKSITLKVYIVLSVDYVGFRGPCLKFYAFPRQAENVIIP